jgi:catechol 2,3-dioxygenase-like lactoylglutathione lyase family enzyme
MSNRSERPEIAHIHTVGVPVSDQSRSLDFYVGKLGFEKRLDAPFGDGRWLEVAPLAPRHQSRWSQLLKAPR